MLCMVNFTTANIYNLHKHNYTLICDLKNYMNAETKKYRRVPVENVLYWLSEHTVWRNIGRRMINFLACLYFPLILGKL